MGKPQIATPRATSCFGPGIHRRLPPPSHCHHRVAAVRPGPSPASSRLAHHRGRAGLERDQLSGGRRGPLLAMVDEGPLVRAPRREESGHWPPPKGTRPAPTDPQSNVAYPGGTIMDVDIRYSPSFALAVITLPPGGEVKAEAGAMTSMSGGVEIETKAQGGMLAGLKRSVLGGESFFINTFRAPSGGELTVSPTLPGDIVHMPVGNSGALMVQSGSWLASDPGVQVDTKWGGRKTFFSGE